jgi:predicted PurR-regulated permease PerM
MLDKNALYKLDYVYKLLFIVALLCFILVWGSELFIPILLGGFIAFALIPVNQWLEKKKIPRILSIIITVFSFIGIIGLFGYLVSIQLADLTKNLPNLESKFNNLINRLHAFIEQNFNLDIKEQKLLLQDGLKNAGSFLSSFLLSTTGILAIIIQIPIYVFLFLLYRNNFKNFLISYFPVRKSNEKNWIAQIKKIIQGYVSGLLLVIIIVAALNTTGLLILGIPYAIFFGVFSAVLTVIPFIGNFIGCALPLLMALITKDSAWYAVGVIGLYVIVQFLEGNVITPRIMGNKVSINALAAIIALLVGGKLLGIAGMIIAIPAMGVLKVILYNSDKLMPFTLLMDEVDQKLNTEDDLLDK